ncbi:MAG TPA: gephyrin-like molybdotransferase Glp [Thermoanaerobaculia bacterium]|nr:gephyrin-like molybdotransferase Glp [Thermoanaerobaculia bacterium]
MLSVDEAQQRVLAEISLIDVEEVALAEAHLRVLREDVRAVADVPLADNSAMDGYAIRAGDAGPLRVIGEVRAGSVSSARVEPGTAMRIMTGAPIPEGADAVAQLEITDRHWEGGGSLIAPPTLPGPSTTLGMTVSVLEPVKRGANIRKRGEDMRAGDVVLRSGTLLRAGEIGVLATAQHPRVIVARRPTVAIISTGDELVDVGERVEIGRVVNSNLYSLAALVREAGAVPKPQQIVRDTREATIAAIERALDCDFVISSGGVSVGAYDFVKDALESLGAETKFWRVAMKPGKPFMLSRVRERLYFGLPGNPVSSMVTFALFVAPALRKAMGLAELVPPMVNMRTIATMRGSERRTYVRVRVLARDGELVAEPMRAQGSGVTTSMAGANGFAVIDAGVDDIAAGEIVPVMLLSLSS